MAILGLIFGRKNNILGIKDSLSQLSTFRGVLPARVGGLGGIVIDATLSEIHRSTCEVTENPVEDGAKITDHVQMNPATLEIEGVISDTPIGFSLLGDITTISSSIATGIGLAGAIAGNFLGGGASLSIQAFNQMIDLQNTRQPFTVITGLKRYTNMILESLEVPRTAQTGNAIHFKATLKQIRIVKSESTTATLAKSVKRTATKVKDFGQKVTDAVPASNSVTDPASKTGSALHNFFGD